MQRLIFFVCLALAVAQQCDIVTKWATTAAAPRYFQRNRGTCWDFATMGILEDSYNKYAHEKGFLEKDKYVQFSEQAYGIAAMEACAKHPEVCNDPGDNVVHGSTDGGEVHWFYFLGELYNKILPVSVCPYPEESSYENEHKCDNYETAVAKNPIRFKVNNMLTGYNVAQTKKIMVDKQASVGWSTLMHNTYFYYPCTDPSWSTTTHCTANSVPCPTDKNYNSQNCAKIESSMFNQDGEFFTEGNMFTEGGHAMVAVGFNDHFVTKGGSKGGFIIKNSWEDLTYGDSPAGRGARGSHSIKYWMQEISPWAERKICPSPLNPNNWLSCVMQSAGITGPSRRVPRRAVLKKGATIDDLPANFDITETCLDDTFLNKITTEQYQATEFQCLDENFCSKDAKYRYFFIRNMRSVDGKTMQTAMLQLDTVANTQKVLVTPYMQDAAIAYLFAPIQTQQDLLKNDDDLCGYYFWPYDLCERQVGLYGDFFSTFFDIEWADSAFEANKAQFPDYDYQYLNGSTGTLRTYEPMCQNPWVTKRFFPEEKK